MLRSLAVCLALAVALPRVAAQPAAEIGEGDKRAARDKLSAGDRALARGDRLMKKGSIEPALEAFEEALAAYQAAHAAYPSPQIFFPIAQAEQRLGRFVEALRHYERLVREGGPLPDPLAAEVRAAIAEVKRNLAGVSITVDPAGATIALDGEVLGQSPLVAPHYVEPGRHVLRVTHPARRAYEVTLELTAGKVSTRDVALERDVVVGAPAPRRAPEGEEEEMEEEPTPRAQAGAPSRAPLYGLIGLTSALALGATATGVVAMNRHDIYGDRTIIREDREAAQRTGKRLALATDVLAGSALVAGALTAIYYVKVYRPRRDERRAHLDLAPWADGQGGGLAALGRF